MNKLDELIGHIRLLFPSVKIDTDIHDEKAKSHWLAARISHAMLLVIWHPGEHFKIIVEADAGYGKTDEIEVDEDVHFIVDFLVHRVLEKGLA